MCHILIFVKNKTKIAFYIFFGKIVFYIFLAIYNIFSNVSVKISGIIFFNVLALKN